MEKDGFPDESSIDFPTVQKDHFVGRKEEIDIIRNGIHDSLDGLGNLFIITGEAGIGKTTLIQSACEIARELGIAVHKGSSEKEIKKPFNILTKAFSDLTQKTIFEEYENVSFTELFAITSSGLLMAKSSSLDEGLDADIFAGMLTAVQNFVKDSFDSSDSMGANLGRLEYGDMKILIENSQDLYLTAVLKGQEHSDMGRVLHKAVHELECSYANVIKDWSGSMKAVEPIKEALDELVSKKFNIRRDLTNIDLTNEINRISEMALDILVSSCDNEPILMVFEDLHFASETSLRVIEYISRNISDLKVTILCSVREGESQIWEEVKDRILEEKGIRKIPLSGLETGKLKDLIDLKFHPYSFTDQLYDRLFEKTEGNPLFALELLKHMIEKEYLTLDNSMYRISSDTMSLPQTIEEMISQKLYSFEPDILSFLELASCIGREFEIDTLRLVSMVDIDDNSLRSLCDAGIIEISGNKGSFSHNIFEEITYKGISPRWIVVNHLKIGKTLEKMHCNDLESVAFELARHFTMARERERGIRYNLLAGELAESMYSMEQAEHYYDSAVNFMGSGYHDTIKLSEILERLADVQNIHGNNEGALENYGKAIELVDHVNDRSRLLRKSANVYETLANYEEAFKFLDMARENLAVSTEMGRIENVAGTLYWRKGEFDKALEHLDKALEIYLSTDSGYKDISDTLRNRGNVWFFKGMNKEALEAFNSSMEYMEDTCDNAGMSKVIMGIGCIYYMEGELETAQEHFLRCVEMTKRTGNNEDLAKALNNLALTLFDKGDLASSIEYHEQSLSIKQKIGDRAGVIDSHLNIGMIYHERGELEKAMEFHKEALKRSESIGDTINIIYANYHIGNVKADMGLLEESLHHRYVSLEKSREIDSGKTEAYNLFAIADTLLKLRRFDEAEDRVLEGIKLAKNMNAKIEEEAGNMVLGSIYAAKCFWDKAESILSLSNERFQILQAPKEVAESDLRLGLALLDKGEKERARKYLMSARDSFSEMGVLLKAKKAEDGLSRS